MGCEVVLQARDRAGEYLETSQHVHLEGLRAASTARRFIREELSDLPEELIDTAELLASEIVTNGILHGRTTIEFGVSRMRDEILVTVADGNDSLPGRLPMPAAEDLTQTGRGMALIVALADDFGWRSYPDRPGKVVWFTLKRREGQRDEPVVAPKD
jgi:anti-sigma regulatory factor (Ser/Thr protein kinase)